jgi:hypothetical protein
LVKRGLLLGVIGEAVKIDIRTFPGVFSAASDMGCKGKAGGITACSAV